MNNARFCLAVFLFCVILTACGGRESAEPQAKAPASAAMEQALEKKPGEAGAAPKKTTFKKVFPHDDVRDASVLEKLYGLNSGGSVFKEGEYDPDDIPSLRYNEGTIFEGCEALASEILEHGKNPGLGVRQLHEQGITGNGVNVAIIDTNLFLNHPEFSGKIAEYYDTGIESPEIGSMHGPAVTSVLVGAEIGTAPGARVYYAAKMSGAAYDDSQRVADGLCWIMEKNKGLPDGRKIRVVSISDDPAAAECRNPEAYLQARKAAEQEGILVIDANSFVWSAYYDYGDDPDQAASYKAGYPAMGPQALSAQKIAAPASLRTVAEQYAENSPSYAYYGDGGVSFAVPYTAGICALGWQVNPALDKDELVDLLFQTAYVNRGGTKIINPCLFIEAVKESIK